MQSESDITTSDQQHQRNSEITLSEYINVVLKYRKPIGIFVAAVFFLSVIVSLILPNIYIATAKILPPQDNNVDIISMLHDADNPLGGLASSFDGSQTPAALYVGIMKSRSVADALIEKFGLKQLYDEKYIEDVYKKLADRTTIKISRKDQIINISVNDRDRQRAADLANAYVELLDQTNRKINITKGKRKRLFLEDRLREVRVEMEKAEIELKRFQEKYNLVAFEEQAKVAIEGAAEIKGQIIAAQTELEVLKQFGTEKQIEAVMLKAKIEELKKQLESIEQGKKPDMNAIGATKSIKESNFYIPFNDLPNLGLQLMRLTRETKIQEKLFELLMAQYEMARIEEAKDVNTIQILDSAVVPEKKDSPHRTIFVGTATLLAIFTAILFSFILESISDEVRGRFKFLELGYRMKTHK